ncbi:membrane protein (plasmid) [Fulvitalea axinellae]|uniref:Membrane protein n=1 Tax=Fulvitalea axinellae TaxID=1182444 RepID=A0AAU9DKM8_9BACT|nr:membrane protein [Fulvitalea axinellae]
MRKIGKYICMALFPLMAGTALTGCDSLLDVEPKDGVERDEFTSADDARAAVMGAYSLFQELSEQNLLVNGLMSDAMDVTASAPASFADIVNRQATDGNTLADPAPYYKLILNCNTGLANLEKLKESAPDLSENDYNGAKAEFLSLRAWAYMSLVNIYGKVAYFETPESEFSKTGNYTIMNREEVLAKLESSINVIYYSSSFAVGDDSSWRQVFLSHVLLAAELNLMLENYEYVASLLFSRLRSVDDGSVTSDYEKAKWSVIFSNEYGKTQNEVLTLVPFDKVNRQQHGLQAVFQRDYWVKPSASTIASFESQTDKGENAGDTYRGEGVSYIGMGNGAQVNKYAMGSGAADDDANIMIYRYADAHLMLAEALNRKGEHQLALDIVNNGAPDTLDNNIGVRGRAFLKAKELIPNGDGSDLTATDSLRQIERIIFEERSLELAFEGRRWADLLRYAHKTPVDGTTDGMDYLIEKLSSKSGEMDETLKQHFADKANWYLPFEIK